MNARSVNSAAGVILAALQQNRTAAGIALALESAGLLMSPEAAADLASVSTDAVERLDRAVGELKREHEISAQLRDRVDEVERKYTFDTAELKRQLDTARVDGQRLIRAEQQRAELEAVLSTHRKDDQAEIERLRARVAELEAERHSTNKALDDAVQALRLRNTQRGDVEQLIEVERGFGEECVDIGKLEAALSLGSDDEAMADGIARQIVPVQVLREDPHDSPLHRTWLIARDLPETGGPR